MGFLSIVGEAEIHVIPKIWEKWIYIVQEKYGKTDISHILYYRTDLELMRTHAIPNVWECTNSHKVEMLCGKSYHSQAVGFWGN